MSGLRGAARAGVIRSTIVRSRAVAVTLALLTGCGSFSAGEAPIADAGAEDSSSADASAPEANAPDASGDDAGALVPLPPDCVERGTSLLDEVFDALPPEGWSMDDPQNLLVLDLDPEDVVSQPASFRAGITPRPSGTATGLIQRVLQENLGETICVTFQGRLFVQGPFGTGRDNAVSIANVELGVSSDDSTRAGVALVVGREGLRLRVQKNETLPIAYGDDVNFQRWTIVIGREARKVTFWIGANSVTLPLEMPVRPEAATLAFGIHATGQVPAVIFHMDDFRVAVLP